MISSFHAAFSLRHRDKSAIVIDYKDKVIRPMELLLVLMLIGGLHGSHLRTDLLNDSYHFMTNGYSWNSTRYTAMFDMEITCADASQSHLDDSICRFYERWLCFFKQCELSFFYECVCLHYSLSLLNVG